jgi:hypothetical protein
MYKSPQVVSGSLRYIKFITLRELHGGRQVGVMGVTSNPHRPHPTQIRKSQPFSISYAKSNEMDNLEISETLLKRFFPESAL